MPLKPVAPGSGIRLSDALAAPPDDLPSGGPLKEALAVLVRRMQELQYALYAEGRQALLIILQGRDAAGKDSTVRHVFGPLNPQGVRVSAFRAPTPEELAHDFLWRVHRRVPARGMIGIFNRSHYEDVLAVRVHRLVPEPVWSRRYAQINDFERLQADSGVTILKFFLQVSREEQRQRLLKRVTDPRRNWKFDPHDLEERRRWDDYTAAYEEVLSRCSPEWAPWFIVPADRKPARDVLIADTVVRTLERMNPEPPPADPAVLRDARELLGG